MAGVVRVVCHGSLLDPHAPGRAGGDSTRRLTYWASWTVMANLSRTSGFIDLIVIASETVDDSLICRPRPRVKAPPLPTPEVGQNIRPAASMTMTMLLLMLLL